MAYIHQPMFKGKTLGKEFSGNSRKYDDKNEIENKLPKAVHIPKPVSLYVSDKLGHALSSSLEEELPAEDIRGSKFIIAVVCSLV